MTRRQTRCTPLPLVGRGWGWGSCGSFAGGAVVISQHHPPPCPSPSRLRACPLPANFKSDQTPAGRGLVGGGNAPSPREQRSRHADDIDHGGFVGVRGEADGGGAGGGKRLRDLAGKTKVHGGE